MINAKNNIQVIVGLGKTGLSCAHHLAGQGIEFAITDSREDPPGLTEIKQHFPHAFLSLGRLDTNLCQQAERLIISPGVSLREPAIANAIAKHIPVIGDIELFAQHIQAPVIAITGSNGKSTVTTLVGEMAQQAGLNVCVGGNLGTPALNLISTQEPDLYVLELSSFQLETTFSLKPYAAVLLNLSEDHMDRYDDLKNYLAAKQRVYHRCKYAIINRQENLLWKNLGLKNLISFGLDAPVQQNFGLRNVGDKWYIAQGDTLLLETKALKIKGRHQLVNATAALALGFATGLPMPAMLNALCSFEGLAHRCQWIANYKNVDWYNDSKATNVAAAQASLEGLGAEVTGKLIVIAGGQGKNANFFPLRNAMQKYVRQLILIGQDASLMEDALKNTTHIEITSSLEKAVALAKAAAQPGDAVILAPACASFDMFKNFEHRGEVFITAVKNILNIS
jgi:UDP-N-acetylmuramoylalanine--D-glutamate ligase